MLRARERASTPCSSIVFNLGLTFESLKELGVRQKYFVLAQNDEFVPQLHRQWIVQNVTNDDKS
jgi:hypothetical protein